MAKSKAGRPTVITKDSLSKLEEWFIYGYTDEQACLYAEISPATLYRYIEENKGFWERKELLKDQTKMRAKKVVSDKIKEWDDYNARWYLERKGKDEFSLKQEVDTKHSWEIKIDSITIQ